MIARFVRSAGFPVVVFILAAWAGLRLALGDGAPAIDNAVIGVIFVVALEHAHHAGYAKGRAERDHADQIPEDPTCPT